MLSFSQTEASLSAEKIKVVAEMTGLVFPEQYKQHLLRYNGGRCEPNAFSFMEDGKSTDSYVDCFLAIYDSEYNNLRDYIEIYKTDEKRLPSHMLPIAHDPGGNLICISCGKRDYGKVYFWDHENEVDYTESTDEDYSNLYLIAKFR